MGLRVESVLALLAESGLTYCILWVRVTHYRVTIANRTLSIGCGRSIPVRF